jgi:hypothetical protein
MLFLLKSILIFFVLSMVLRAVLPALLRWALSAFVRKQMQRGGAQFGPGGAMFAAGGSPFDTPPPAQPGPEGKVRVDYVPPTQKPRRPENLKGGEYVDFEEVK